MTILLDTSVIIDALRARRGRREFLDLRNQAGDTLACSTVTVAEIYAGMRPGEASATREYLENLICIEVTREIAQTAGTLKYIWARKGLTLDIPDAIVAATTLTFNLHLATDNRKHFPMPEIIHIQIPTS